jgi:hypothetical protein
MTRQTPNVLGIDGRTFYLHPVSKTAREISLNVKPPINWQAFSDRLDLEYRQQDKRRHDFAVVVSWDSGEFEQVFTSRKAAEAYIATFADPAVIAALTGEPLSWRDLSFTTEKRPINTTIAKPLTPKMRTVLVACRNASHGVVTDKAGARWALVDKMSARVGFTPGQFGGGLSALKRAGLYNKGWVRT